MTVEGVVSCSVGVTQVTWANSRGGGGTASGTTSWTASGIVLKRGNNVLTVTAKDAAGNIEFATLTVNNKHAPGHKQLLLTSCRMPHHARSFARSAD